MLKKKRQTEPFIIAETPVLPGEAKRVDLPSASIYTQAPMHIPVYVHHSKYAGPKLFITAIIHGDEINGGEIIRRLLTLPVLKRLRGTLLAVPIANVYGFIALSRYLPDRRDLNRVFPGSKTGSLAARLAYLLLNEVVKKADYGLDLHTGAAHRDNLPQIRIDKNSPPAVDRLARAFGAPVIMKSNILPGSLRHAAAENGIPVLVYEGGEALRFDENAIRVGMKGCLNVMRDLGMLPPLKKLRIADSRRSMLARSSVWVRAPGSGIIRTKITLGTHVAEKQSLGFIDDPFTGQQIDITAQVAGIVIGKTNLPLANEGDAVFHIACVKEVGIATQQAEEMKKSPSMYIDPLLDGWT